MITQAIRARPIMGPEVAMFDSPFAWCPKCGEAVLLDQTKRECADEHRCGDIQCPLEGCFVGIDFRIKQPGKEEENERLARAP